MDRATESDAGGWQNSWIRVRKYHECGYTEVKNDAGQVDQFSESDLGGVWSMERKRTPREYCRWEGPGGTKGWGRVDKGWAC